MAAVPVLLLENKVDLPSKTGYDFLSFVNTLVARHQPWHSVKLSMVDGRGFQVSKPNDGWGDGEGEVLQLCHDIKK